MRCMRCGAEMILMNTIDDETMAVPGFERHAYMCSECHDTEQRLVFNKQSEKRGTDTLAVPAPSPTAPVSTQNPRKIAHGFLRRALAKIRGR